MTRFPAPAVMVAMLATLAEPIVVLADDGTRSRSFDAKGVKIHFLVEGKGEPVVLIHGLHSSTKSTGG